MMNKKINNNEIDLIELIINLWNNKFKIIFITIIFLLAGLFYQLTQKESALRTNAVTEIVPITTNDAVKYDAFNFFIQNEDYLNPDETTQLSNLEETNKNIPQKKFKSKKIVKSYLLELFIDLIKKDEFVSSIIKESKLIKKESYINNEEYENKVNQLVQSIKLLHPDYDEESDRQLSNWGIQFQANDINAWRNFLKLLNDSTNREVQLIIRNNFENYKISRRTLHQYKIENIETKITNALENYELETSNRLAFLTEQAAIARKLNISRANLVTRTLESQTFSTESGIITNLRTEMPYYMRGYEMIEKEIELIKERKEPQLFNTDLVKLRQKKQVLLQDKAIKRMQSIFEDTPIMKSNKFYAAKIMFEKTTYTNDMKKDNKLRMIILAGIIGLILGILYVMFSLAIQKRINNGVISKK